MIWLRDLSVILTDWLVKIMEQKMSLLKIASFTLSTFAAAVAFSSASSAFDWEAPALAVNVESHSGADMAQAYSTSQTYVLRDTFLGSDVMVAASILQTERVGTHFGVDLASAYVRQDAISIQSASASLPLPSIQ